MADANSIRSDVLAWFERDDHAELRIPSGELGSCADEVAVWAREQGYLVHRESEALVLRKVSRIAKRLTPRPTSFEAIARRRKLW